MSFVRTTEADSKYDDLEKREVSDLLQNINNEDKLVPQAIEQILPQIEKLTHAVIEQLDNGGRLFYIGAGTSGRIGILDASEWPPTFGVPHYLANGVIAGGSIAITTPVEGAEDNTTQAWIDLQEESIDENDIVIGLSASGTTPYVLGGLKACRLNGVPTGSICCNENSPISKEADFPIEVVVGPEFVTGSTRMKSGTAQKLILNMISTTTMIKLGRVEGNKMVHMQLTNEKLVNRGIRMLMEKSGIRDFEKAKSLLVKYGKVSEAMKHIG